MTKKELAAKFDHTILKAFATSDMVKKACQEAIDLGCATLAVNTYYVKMCAELCKGTKTGVDAAIGFPLGQTPTSVKVYETKQAIADGAKEIDMVINIGALKEGLLDYVRDEISQIVVASEGHVVKVILETCYLTDEEKVTACRLATEAGSNYVKTSTGFGTAGATPHDVALMRASVPSSVKIKAAGGMRSWEAVKANIEAGADRIGISASLDVLREFDESTK